MTEQGCRTRYGPVTHRARLTFAVGSLLILAVTACSPTPTAAPVSPSPTSTGPVPASASPSADRIEESPAPVEESAEIVGTVVRFTSDRTTVDVTVGEDSAGVRDFLSLLPTQLTIEEFSGKEKISYLPRKLDSQGSSGSDPEDGDLIYFTPWGNLGFYYDASGIGYSDATLHIGTYTATEEQLALLEGGPVTVDIVR